MNDENKARWLTSWAQAHTDLSFLSGGVKNNTARITVKNRISGSAIRICLSNQCGKKPVELIRASVGLANQAPVELQFAGKTALRLDPQNTVCSDPVEMNIPDGAELSVSVAIKGKCNSGNNMAEIVRYSPKGDFTMEAVMPELNTMDKEIAKTAARGHGPFMPLLSRIEIYSTDKKNIVACFGDSITHQCKWTKPLDERCAKSAPDTVIVNMGIDGNKLLTDPMMKLMSMFGEAGIKRFQRDILDAPGVSSLIVALGTNDIGMARNKKMLAENDHNALMNGLLELSRKAKAAGMKTYVATVTPRGGSSGYKAMHETERLLLNEAIRSSTAFDGILDYDAVVKDEKNPDHMREDYQRGDYLHPSAEGGLRLAEVAYRTVVAK